MTAQGTGSQSRPAARSPDLRTPLAHHTVCPSPGQARDCLRGSWHLGGGGGGADSSDEVVTGILRRLLLESHLQGAGTLVGGWEQPGVGVGDGEGRGQPSLCRGT